MKEKEKKPSYPNESKPKAPEFQRRGLSILRPPPKSPPPRRPNHSNHLNLKKTVAQNPNLLSQALRTDDQPESDRISALPDAVLHNILSHLDTREVVHTSILSNKWRYLWLSTPYLDFDLNTWLNKCRRPSWTGRREAFMDFADNVLIRRETLHDISKFSLHSHGHDSNFDLRRVCSWLSMCVERNVKHICLEYFILSSEIFTCMSSASTIKYLWLHGVRLPDGNAHGELVFDCRVLEDFNMCNCDVRHLKTLTISTPLLEKLWLSLFSGTEPTSKVNVKIHTPNLKSIFLASCSTGDSSPVHYTIEDDLLSLVSAYVHIVEYGCLDPIGHCSDSVIKILSRVYYARVLRLSISTEQVLTDFPILSDGLPYKFQNLKHITLVDHMQTPCIQAITNFLVCLPRIESLVWERSSVPGKEGNVKDILLLWKEFECERYEEADGAEESVADRPAESISSLSSKCTCGRLKIVKTLELEGSDIELSFLAFVIERAIYLEEIIIGYSPSLSSEKLACFKEKVLSLPHASSNVSVSFRMSVNP